jgi:acyl-CoA reductase-like NAD-dependent aldehyde dehydrogenase
MNRKNDIEIRNPYNNESLGFVSTSTNDEITAAIKASHKAFLEKSLPSIDRHDILSKTAELLKEKKSEFAELITRETGKPIKDSRFEVDRACMTLSWCAQEALRIDGIIQHCDVTPQRLDKNAHVHRVPLGIVAAITPFNFPLNIPAHKAGPALAAGNSVIIKPSLKTPLSTTKFIELFYEAGLDRDLLQVLNGGAEVVENLVRGNIQAVTFTGSTAVGKQICAWAAGKKIMMELGGNDPIVVMDDADIDKAVTAIITHRFSFSGQRCTSCKRAIIHELVYETVKHKLIERILKLKIGDPLDQETDISKLIDEGAADMLMQRLDAARNNGAHVLCGGRREKNLVYPTLVENVDSGDELYWEENFGPILNIAKFSNFEEAVSLVNSTPYGLQAGIFTNNIEILKSAFKKFDVGTLVHNDGPGLRIEPIPFGGVKSSGIGREGIRHAIDEMTTLKTLVF